VKEKWGTQVIGDIVHPEVLSNLASLIPLFWNFFTVFKSQFKTLFGSFEDCLWRYAWDLQKACNSNTMLEIPSAFMWPTEMSLISSWTDYGLLFHGSAELSTKTLH